jgi:hypothetical protein
MTERFWWNGTNDGVGSIMDNETGDYLSYSQCIPMLNKLHEENVELREAMKRLMADLMMPR